LLACLPSEAELQQLTVVCTVPVTVVSCHACKCAPSLVTKFDAVCLSSVPSGGTARPGAGFLTPPPDPQPGAADGTGGDTHGGDTYSEDTGSGSAGSTVQRPNSQAAGSDTTVAAEPLLQGELCLDIGLRSMPETEYGWAAHPVAASVVAAVAAREPKAERSLMHRYNAGVVRSSGVAVMAPVHSLICALSTAEHSLGFAWPMAKWRVRLCGEVQPHMERWCSADCRPTTPAGSRATLPSPAGQQPFVLC
jgi:hypothetical protein